jgi:cytochrome c biogenesis protein CcdA
VLSALTVLVAVGVAVAAAIASCSSGRVTGGVEAASTASATLLGQLGRLLPLGYAFSAGMVAAVNPCGFALLPAYLSLYLGARDTRAGEAHAGHRVVLAIKLSTMVTLSFVALFGVAGLALGTVSLRMVRALPELGQATGVLLLLAAGVMLSGGAFYTSLGGSIADRAGRHAQGAGMGGFFAYGVAYGAASLSCTLPIFLTVVGGALTARGVWPSTLGFVLYGLGMGTVLTALTFAAALFKTAAVATVRRATRYLSHVSAVLLLLAGAYLVYYWLSLGGVLAGLVGIV